jgi:hypothetical protein
MPTSVSVTCRPFPPSLRSACPATYTVCRQFLVIHLTPRIGGRADRETRREVTGQWLKSAVCAKNSNRDRDTGDVFALA